MFPKKVMVRTGCSVITGDTSMWQETAALRDFNVVYDRSGSVATDAI
jgi:hypothetical protein